MIQGQVIDGRFECRGTTSRPEPGESWIAWDGNREVVLRLVSGTVGDELERAAFSRATAAAMKMAGHSVEKTIHAGFVDNNRPYVVTEKTSGRPLSEELAAGQAFDVSRSLEIAIAVAESLAEAAQHNICHGHLSPAVIMLAGGTRKGKRKASHQVANTIRVLGFSPWEAVPSATVFSRDAVAPEVADGSLPDISSDCWSLGHILYRMITGSTPEKEAARQSGRKAARFPAPSSVRPDAGITPELDILVLRLLEADPGRRMASPVQLVAHLKTLLSGDGVTGVTTQDNAVPEAAPAAAVVTQESDLDEGISFASGKRVRTTSMHAASVAGNGSLQPQTDVSAAIAASDQPDEPVFAPARHKTVKTVGPAAAAGSAAEKRSGGISTIVLVLLIGFFVLAAISVTGWFVLRYQDRQLELARGRATDHTETAAPVQPAATSVAKPEPAAVQPVQAEPSPAPVVVAPETTAVQNAPATATVPAGPDGTANEAAAAPKASAAVAPAPVAVPAPVVSSKPATTVTPSPATAPAPATARQPAVKSAAVGTVSDAKKPTTSTKPKPAATGTKRLNWDAALDEGDIETAPAPKAAGTSAPKTDSTTRPALQWDE